MRWFLDFARQLGRRRRARGLPITHERPRAASKPPPRVQARTLIPRVRRTLCSLCCELVNARHAPRLRSSRIDSFRTPSQIRTSRLFSPSSHRLRPCHQVQNPLPTFQFAPTRRYRPVFARFPVSLSFF